MGGRGRGEEGALGLLAIPCGADPGACLGEVMGTFPQGRAGRGCRPAPRGWLAGPLPWAPRSRAEARGPD